MSWLWFLPVLFLFDGLYLLLRKLDLPTDRLTLSWAVVAVFVLSIGYSVVLSDVNWLGWT